MFLLFLVVGQFILSKIIDHHGSLVTIFRFSKGFHGS